MLGFKRRSGGGGAFLFRVSDVVEVPLRGTVLRLRVVEGTPSLADLGPGALLQLKSPDGTERRVRIVGHSITGGRQTQARLDQTRELDVLIAEEHTSEQAPSDSAAPLEIGWMASGPVRDADRG